MSQQSHPDGAQAFAAGRGLLAAAETLNFNMSDSRAGLQMGGVGLEGDGGPSMSRLGSTMKLFASLGLSPADLDALAQIPEEDISVETLPHILRQLKSRKAGAAERRPAPTMSSEAAFKGGRDSWDSFGFGGVQDVPSSRPYGLNYGGGAGGRDRPFSELPLGDSYGELGVGPSSSSSSSDFMQRRPGPPPHRKVQDFLGVMPPTFPHVCCLCDFDVVNLMEWNQHVDGIRHADNRRRLLHMYPEWDPGMSSSRGGGPLDSNMSSSLLGPPLISSTPSAGGMSSGWGRGGGGGGGGGGPAGPSKLRTCVVVVKYDRKPLSMKTLLAFTEPFGHLREHLILKNKAFFEMSSYEEALDMVTYYERNPASLFGKPLTFYLSKRLMNIQKEEPVTNRPAERPLRDVKSYGSRVVFFSNLPREQEKKMELLTISARFGVVEKHIFLNDQAFVQLGTPEDAEMLVKYYSQNMLTIRGRPIRLNICAKYKTLDLTRRQGGSAGDGRGSRGSRFGSGTRTSSTSHRTSSTSSTSSSRPSRSREERKRRESEEKRGKPEEEEEGVSGVMEGDEDGGEEEQEEEPEGGAESGEESGEVQQVEVPGGEEVTDDRPEDVGRAEGEEEKEAEPEAQTSAEAEEKELKEEPSEEPAESAETMEEPEDMDQDFLENMEDFVTLDELPEEDSEVQESESIDNSRKGGMRVVTIVGFRRGFRFLDELLALAKPFGKVVKHLVLDMKPEAYLQFETEAEARAMDAFYYNSNVKVSVCGRPVTVSHSSTYPTIQCGSSRVVYLGKIPFTNYTDASILKLAEPYGKISKYFLNRNQNECFIEMERAEDAEKMVESSKANLIKFKGKRLTIYVSRKYRTLKYGHRPPAPSKRDSSSSKSSRQSEEPPAKKQKEEKEEEKEEETREETKEETKEEKTEETREETKKMEEEETEEMEEKEETKEEKKMEEEKTEEKVEKEEMKKIKEEKEEEEPSAEQAEDSSEKVPEAPDQSGKMDQDQVEKETPEEDVEAPTNQNGETEAAPPPQTKPTAATLPLPPFDPNSPIGVEHVKMGYYCRVCFLFYSSEDTAKKTHCSSQSHYDKLKKHLEKEKKTKKKTSA